MTCGIYAIVNIIDAKYYIGSSKDVEFRFKTHRARLNSKSHKNSYLQSAWDKYGEDIFKFVVIEICSKIELLSVEQKWINNSKCYDRIYGYNLMTDPVRNEIGLEARMKISKALKGKPKSKIHIANMRAYKRNHSTKGVHKSNGWIGKKHSEETKNKIREALKNRRKSLDENLKISSILVNPSLSGL